MTEKFLIPGFIAIGDPAIVNSMSV
jgi:hypothetical protein